MEEFKVEEIANELTVNRRVNKNVKMHFEKQFETIWNSSKYKLKPKHSKY